jgi:hypothetical protein
MSPAVENSLSPTRVLRPEVGELREADDYAELIHFVDKRISKVCII